MPFLHEIAILQSSLQSLLLVDIRNERYFLEIRQLQEALEHYQNSPDDEAFHALFAAIVASLHFIEQKKMDFSAIRKPTERLAEAHGMEPIEWDKELQKNTKVTPRFQFSALNHAPEEEEFFSWISEKLKQPFESLNNDERIQALIDYCDDEEFNKKFTAKLDGSPNAIEELIDLTEKCSFAYFKKICSSVLNLYLTDEQVAQGILRHLPSLTDHKDASFENVESLTNAINSMLRYGRSVSTLLRNTGAQAILNSSEFFQVYQSEEYKNRNSFTPSKEDELIGVKSAKK